MAEIKSKIIELRNAIRYARDQIADDRCWLDYRKAYSLLPDTNKEDLTKMPNYEEAIKLCTAFYDKRKSRDVKIPRKITPTTECDFDLEKISEEELKTKLNILENEVRKHRDIPIENLTLKEDIKLYRLLPEKVPQDFRLPKKEEFLGASKKYAGCQNFWKSHESCTILHNLHIWGPVSK